MANWQRKLELSDVWDREVSGKTITELAGIVAQRLRRLRPIGDDDLDYEQEEIADEFEDISSDPDLDADDFDGVLARLYDWADTPLDDKWPRKKVCWVATF